MVTDGNNERASAALARVAEIWEARLTNGWTPPAGSSFPWEQVRISLAALLPGMRSGPPSPPIMGGAPGSQDQLRVRSENSPHHWGVGGAAPGRRVTLILAGNTPLLSWSPLCACLLAGANRIHVKMSRDETLWTPLLLESIAEADAEVAARITLYDFPGEDERTTALLQEADAVIAFGSDRAIEALQAKSPASVPFFGYGHAVSVGLVMDSRSAATIVYDFAKDIQMYEQQGCLSPHVIYYLPNVSPKIVRFVLTAGNAWIGDKFPVRTEFEPVVAAAIREARDLALFEGHSVRTENSLFWTVIQSESPIPYPEPVGYGVIYASLVESPEQLAELLAPVRGIVSCAGVAGKLTPEWEAVLRDAGVSRICAPGEMQAPPLDWPNGNRDLLAELRTIFRGG